MNTVSHSAVYCTTPSLSFLRGRKNVPLCACIRGTSAFSLLQAHVDLQGVPEYLGTLQPPPVNNTGFAVIFALVSAKIFALISAKITNAVQSSK